MLFYLWRRVFPTKQVNTLRSRYLQRQTFADQSLQANLWPNLIRTCSSFYCRSLDSAAFRPNWAFLESLAQKQCFLIVHFWRLNSASGSKRILAKPSFELDADLLLKELPILILSLLLQAKMSIWQFWSKTDSSMFNKIKSSRIKHLLEAMAEPFLKCDFAQIVFYCFNQRIVLFRFWK